MDNKGLGGGLFRTQLRPRLILGVKDVEGVEVADLLAAVQHHGIFTVAKGAMPKPFAG